MATTDKILEQQRNYYATYRKIPNNPRYKKAWRFLLERGSEGSLLDIGCADGEFSEVLIRRGYDCHGVEFMDEAYAQSSAKGIKVKKASFLDGLPYEDERFKYIFAGEVIEHTTDDEAFLNEAYRVLQKNGYLILTTPNLLSLGNRGLMLLGRMPRFAYQEFHYRMYSQFTLNKKITETGFTILKNDASYIGVSTAFNKMVGLIGEKLGTAYPRFGEHLIVFAKKQ